MLVAALVAGVAGAPVASARAAQEPVAGAAEVPCVEEAADDVAMATAVACDADVEVVDERTEWNTVFAQPDGQMRLDVSALAVRTLADGRWVEPDPDLVEQDGVLTPGAGVAAMVFSGGGDEPLATIARDGHELALDVDLDLPAPTVDGPQITYADVLPDVDLVVTVNQDATGFSEVLVVHTPQAAEHPELDELRFALQTSEGLTTAESAGGFVATAGEEEVFTAPAPLMWDSSGVESEHVTTSAPLGTDALETMDLTVEADAVVVEPDAQMLTDPGTEFPVYIDPGVSASLNDWTAVRDTYGADYRFAPDQGIGLCSTATSSTCSKTFTSRILWKFTGLATVNNLAPENVTGATFRVFGSHSYDCTARPVTLYRVDNFTSGTGWPGGPTWISQSSASVAHKDSCAGSPTRWIEFSAMEAARAVANSSSGQLTLGLRTDESSMASWKRYRNDAQLSITYERAPNKPTGAKFSHPGTSACTTGSGRPVLRSLNPHFYAVFSDPDGGNVHANVDVYKASAASGSANILWHARPAAQASGKGQSIVLGGMVHGQIYRVQVNGVDGTGRGGAAVSCEVEIDTVPPKTPTVTPVAGQPAVYLEDVSSGGPNLKGRFALGNGGSSDIVTYQYSFTSRTAFDNSVTAAAAAFDFTPTSRGAKTLYVRSVDRAGNTSPVRLYTFDVNEAQRTWLLDDGGSTAAPWEEQPVLDVSASTAWAPGPLAESGFSPNDKALLFDEDSDAVTGPVWADTSTGYGVIATLRADDLAASRATAVSQDGTAVSAFELGFAPCADGDGRCWAFTANSSATTASAVSAVSTIKVTPGRWVSVTGTHDAAADQITVRVCPRGQYPDEGVATSFTTPWSATGSTVIGRAQGGTSSPWRGAVADLRVFRGLPMADDLLRACHGVVPE
ncbi:LamG-like jellyroll fold domain-containing protein [Cellulomonas sp. SLBN-39]|uniref:LamG-like jellyroll fold domain-containing protein n=1 Tax=Cellulomonas sp. SLBN-39 TaxID=2768446 RepID=UPI001359F7CA|nr:LamG-like jellyroll fold domain-containing protein [Cellulomonas sp. SLBN-39]